MNTTGLKLIALDSYTNQNSYGIYEFNCTVDTENSEQTIRVAEGKDPIYKAFCYPDCPETRAFLQEQIEHKAKMVALEDAHQTLMYQKLNQLKREGKR